MGLRSWLANALNGHARRLARSAGCELQVTLSDHSIETSYVDPDSKDLAWDDNMYRYGNVFYDGYANPIKPVVNENKDLDDPDSVDCEESAQNGAQDADEQHVSMMSSPRFASFMRQHLIEQLLNPQEKWRILMLLIAGVGALTLINVVISLSAAGAF